MDDQTEIVFDSSLVIVVTEPVWEAHRAVPRPGELVRDVVRRVFPGFSDHEIRDISDREISALPTSESHPGERVYVRPRPASTLQLVTGGKVSPWDRLLAFLDARLPSTTGRLLASPFIALLPVLLAAAFAGTEGWVGPTLLARLLFALAIAIVVGLRVGIGGLYLGMILLGLTSTADLACHFGFTSVTALALVAQAPQAWPWLTKRTLGVQKVAMVLVGVWFLVHLWLTMAWYPPGQGGSLSELYIAWWTSTAWLAYSAAGALTDRDILERARAPQRVFRN